MSLVRVGWRHQVPWQGPEDSFDLGLTISFESSEMLAGYGPHPLHKACIAAARGARGARGITEHALAYFFDAV